MPSNIKLMMMWGNVREYATQASNFQKSSATQSTYLLMQLAAYQANSASMMKPISLSVASGGSSGTAHYESALSEHHFCGLDLPICCDTTIHIDLWKNYRLPPRVLRWNHLDSKISKTNGFETDAVICSMIFCWIPSPHFGIFVHFIYVLVWTKPTREIQSKSIQTNEEKDMEKKDKNCY